MILGEHVYKRLTERASVTDFKQFNSITINSTLEIKKNITELFINNSFVGYRLWFNPLTTEFFVLVVKYLKQIDGKIISDKVKTALTVEQFENSYKGFLITEKMKINAAKKSGNPSAVRNWASNNNINLSSNRRQFIVQMENGRKNIRLGANIICQDFLYKTSATEILNHPGVLTRLHQQCEKLNIDLAERLWIRYSLNEFDGVYDFDKKAIPKTCLFCGAAPLPTDLPIPTKIKDSN